jgi:hypothetical protein
VNGVEKRALTWLARIMFGGQFGWQTTLPSSASELSIASADGSALEGALVAARGVPRGVVVACHPFLKYGFHYFLKNGVADALADRGLHVVIFNFKGFGRSEVGGPVFADDVVGAVDHACAAFPLLPIYLFGASFGGYQAVHALPRLDGLVASVVLDSVPDRASRFFRRPPLSFAMRALARSRWNDALGTTPLERPLARVRVSAIDFIHGDADAFCPRDEIRALASAATTARVTCVAGAKHLECARTDRATFDRLLARAFGGANPSARAA